MQLNDPVERINRSTRVQSHLHAEPRVAVELDGARIELDGILALILRYLVTDAGLVARIQMEGAVGGQLVVHWNENAKNVTASTQHYYPGRGSTSLTGQT